MAIRKMPDLYTYWRRGNADCWSFIGKINIFNTTEFMWDYILYKGSDARIGVCGSHLSSILHPWGVGGGLC